MFGLFRKKKQEEYKITITRTSDEATSAAIIEREFLRKAHTCPGCSHLNDHPMIRIEGDGRKYSVPVKCRKCSCEWTYERPYTF